MVLWQRLRCPGTFSGFILSSGASRDRTGDLWLARPWTITRQQPSSTVRFDTEAVTVSGYGVTPWSRAGRRGARASGTTGSATPSPPAWGFDAYVVGTKALGATTIAGLVAGGETFLVTERGSKLIGWISWSVWPPARHAHGSPPETGQVSTHPRKMGRWFGHGDAWIGRRGAIQLLGARSRASCPIGRRSP